MSAGPHPHDTQTLRDWLIETAINIARIESFHGDKEKRTSTGRPRVRCNYA